MATPKTPAPAEAEFIPIHEDEYLSEELTEKFGEEIWIHKPTGRPYFPGHQMSRIFAKAPYLDHDDPYLQFLRDEIEL